MKMTDKKFVYMIIENKNHIIWTNKNNFKKRTDSGISGTITKGLALIRIPVEERVFKKMKNIGLKLPKFGEWREFTESSILTNWKTDIK